MTVYNYIESGIIYLLEPYMSSKIKRITHMPKIIFMDTGLAAYLAGWDSAKELQLSSVSGHYLESFIIYSSFVLKYVSSFLEIISTNIFGTSYFLSYMLNLHVSPLLNSLIHFNELSFNPNLYSI